MSSSTDTPDIEAVASKLQELSLKENGASLPMPQQLYAMGTVLFRIQGNEQHEGCRELLTAYREMIDSMPVEYSKKLFRLFHRGLATLIIESRSSSSSSMEQVRSAVQSIGGLLCNSPQACKLAYSKDWLSSLSSIYDIHILKDSSRIQKDEVLALISRLLVEGLLASDAKEQPESLEELLMAAIQTMEEESTDCLRDLQDWERRLEPSHGSLENTLKNRPFNEDTLHQREYIFNMLETSRLKEPTENTSILDVDQKPTAKPTKVKAVSAAEEMERRIAQVKQIIPDLGEGFIETALSLYQGNVETTVSTLLNDPSQYPPNLQFLDRSLPRRKKARAVDEEKDSAEARQLVKERMALEAQQEQERYKALLYVSAQQKEQNEQMVNEYDDDYDDQYDDIDVKLGDTDGGLYDFETMKIYNKIAREGEAEDSFWEANRNTNRASDKGDNSNNGGQKQFRGPDKIKGGRIVGPDGKIVRKPNHKRNKQQAAKQQQQQQQQGPGKAANGNNSNKNNDNGNKKPAPNANGNNNNGNNNNGGQNQKGKPRTKPKSNNRVNRQRDKKQKAQGNFGGV